MTSAFTAAYSVALQAKEMAREKLPKTAIEVIDSRTTGSGLALIVLEAVEMAAQGKDISEIARFVSHLIPKVNFLSTRDTLLCMDKGGGGYLKPSPGLMLKRKFASGPLLKLIVVQKE